MRPARLALTELSQERLVATRRTMAANGCGVKQGDEGNESIEYLVADWLQGRPRQPPPPPQHDSCRVLLSTV
jgi:hypothetical protein